MTIRRASHLDAAVLAEHRAAVWHEVGEWNASEIALQVPVWEAFFRDRLRDGTYVAFIAEEDAGAVGSGAILVHLTIPRPMFDSDRAGRVQSVYVARAARRQGIARAIMAQLLDYARATMLVSLSLHPSDAARPLYAALGFEETDEMMLRL